MGRATLAGLFAAILLIASLILGALDVIVPGNALNTSLGVFGALGEFALVILAAAIVVAETRIVSRQLETELNDVPDLKARGSGRRGA